MSTKPVKNAGDPQPPAPKVPKGWSPKAELHYTRKGEVANLKSHGISNEEAVQLVVGLWLRLEPAQRQQVVDALATRGAQPSAALYGTDQALAENLAADVPPTPATRLFDPRGKLL